MNSVTISGYMAAEPQVKYGNTTVAKFRLGVTRGKDKGTDWINCTAFGNTAELVAKYLTKGAKVAILGRLQTGSYEKQDGTKVWTTDVIANSIEFMSRGEKKEEPKEAMPMFEAIDEAIPF